MAHESKREITGETQPRVARGHRLQWEEVQDSYVMLYPEGMVTLNMSAYEILSRCDGNRTVTDIVTELQAAFPEAELEAEVYEFLRLADAQGWLEQSRRAPAKTQPYGREA